jgi:hypothetical protein
MTTARARSPIRHPLPTLEPLEPRLLFTSVPSFIVDGASGRYAAGLWNLHTNKLLDIPATQFYPGDPGWAPFGKSFTGGINSAVGDINADGIPDVIFAPASKGKPLIQVYNAVTGVLERSFFAYSTNFWGGVNVASADINGDGKADIVTAPASNGVPLVNVYDGASGRLIRSFYAYTPNFHGGATVAAADVNDDGHADIITGTGFGGVPLVNIFSGTNNTLLGNFYAFNPRFRGGVVLAAGDMEGNGHADIAVGVGFGGNGNIRVFSGTTLSQRFNFSSAYTTGVSIALTDYDGDHLPDLVTSHKLFPYGLSGGGIYKGTNFAPLGSWGNTTGFEQSGPTGDLISGWTAPP